MLRALLAASVLLTAACASGAAGVRVDRFRGVYSTHFDGIPDLAGVCAVVSNRSERAHPWIRLRMDAFGERNGRPWQWKSHWLYPKPLQPGETVALWFENAPHAPQLEIRVDRIGRTPQLPRHGRTLKTTSTCSEASLERALKRLNADRKPQGVQVLPIVRRNHPAPVLEAEIADAQ